MAFRTWGRRLLCALGVAALAGAGQLGFAYGLGIVRFARAFDNAAQPQWPAQLAWVSWFAMVAAVAGAVAAERLARREGYACGTRARAALSCAAGFGAAAVAPLCMLPARAAQVASVDPVSVTGLSAGLGAVVGMFAALAVLTYRPIAWNVAAITGCMWLLALVSVAPSLGPTDPLPAVRLGVLDPAWLASGTAQGLAVDTMPALALVAGAATGAVARWRGHPMLVVAACGAAGPAMLALAYLVAGPGDSADKYQAGPYWGGLLAAGAGALGSVLATVRRPVPVATGDVSDTALEPTGISHPVRGDHGDDGDGLKTSSTTTPDVGNGGETTNQDTTRPRGGAHAIPIPRQATHDRSPAPAGSADAPRAGRRSKAERRPAPASPPPSAPANPPTPVNPPRAETGNAGKRGGDRAAARNAPGDRAARDKATTDKATADKATRDSADPGAGGGARRGLLRRGRPVKTPKREPAGDTGSPAADVPNQRQGRKHDRPERALTALEEEHVDWVSGLGVPEPGRDDKRRDPRPRRSLRSSGRRQAE